MLLWQHLEQHELWNLPAWEMGCLLDNMYKAILNEKAIFSFISLSLIVSSESYPDYSAIAVSWNKTVKMLMNCWF